ncbi:MAG: MlaD family protein [Fulvimonas sp.]|nr:MlaD family protein [Fulvimonas sp.]
MSDEHKPGPYDDLPEPAVRRRRLNASLIWLVPTLAALVGLSLAVKAWLQQGPTIRISFASAEGVEADKTEVKYKNVVIGKVESVDLSEDRKRVIVKVALNKSAESFATAGTRYWVERPRIGLGGVSGVGTLLSGSYIGADVGDSQERKAFFVGLENPPAVMRGAPGKSFVLHSDDLGSLDIGSPVYYRRIRVGRVSSYQLDEDGKGVTLRIFVDGPNDRYVTRSARFWNASGVDVSLGADGLKVNSQSLATVVAGGVAFQDPPGPHDTTPAAEDTRFTLFADRATAMAPPDGPGQYVRMRFDQSVRGLAVGAPVEFLGVNIGRVVSINLDYDAGRQRFPALVGALLYPQRLGRAYEKLAAEAASHGGEEGLLGTLVAHGLRAQMRVGNLLTGQMYVALDFVPNAPKATFDPRAKPLELPTAPGSFDKLQEQVVQIVDKVQKIPFDSIGRHLDDSLAGLDGALKQVNGQLLPQLNRTLEGAQQTLHSANGALSADAPLQRELGDTLEQLQRMARSLRALTDYLGVHPEALLRGRQDAPPPPAPPSPGRKP